MFRIFFLIILFLNVGVVLADPQPVMWQQQDPDLLRERISQLKELRNNSQLSYDEKRQLDELWQDAATIEIMNDRCGYISITEEIDASCGHFYQYELPKFETKFFKLTGEIRLSPTRLSNAIEQKRQAIQQCYDALQIEAFYPTRYFKLEGKYTPEPLSKGIEVSYDFRLQSNEDAIDDLGQRLKEWQSVCGNIILHSDNSGQLAPLFVDLIQKSKSEANNVIGGLYFERAPYGYSEIIVKTKEGINGIYYLNGRELFHYNISPNSRIFALDLNNKYQPIRIIQGERWRDNVVFKDEEVEKGLTGRFIWEKPRAHRKKPAKTSLSAPRAEYSSNYDQWDSEDDYQSYSDDNASESSSRDFGLQVLGGFNLSLGTPGSSSKFDDAGIDSLYTVTGYVSALLYLEFNREFALAFGGGISWNGVNAEYCSNYYNAECDEKNIYFSARPIATAELNFGDGLNGGLRFHYIFDPDLTTFYLGGFAELGNLVGIEIGWVHTDGLWDNIYMGFTLRIPPRHFSERINKALKK